MNNFVLRCTGITSTVSCHRKGTRGAETRRGENYFHRVLPSQWHSRHRDTAGGKIFLILLIAVFSIKAGRTSLSETYNDKSFSMNQIYGKWCIKKYVSMPVSAYTDEEATKFIGKFIILRSNYAVVINDSCDSPDYKFNKENTEDFLTKKIRVDRKELGIEGDSLYVINLKCTSSPKYYNDNSPNFNFYIFTNNNKLFVKYQGIIFILEKQSKEDIKGNILPSDGDTVRCFEGEKCAFTGYVIQGTRAKGAAIHVTPVNKNVPMEVVDPTMFKSE
jgi:hypothetical protein